MAEKKTMRMLWLVGHEAHHNVWVEAKDWPMATVEAAEIWGVRWGQVAAGCFLVQQKKYLGGVCAKCGKFFNGGGTLCGACEKGQRDEAIRSKRHAAKYFMRENREFLSEHGQA